MSNLPQSQQHQTSLVVILHAYTRKPRDMRYVRQAVSAAKPNAHILTPKLPLGGFSCADANQIAAQIVTEITEQVQFRLNRNWAKFSEILLIGHSMGALIARKAYLIACGISEAPLDDPDLSLSENIRQPWAADVKRIILLAGMNRGWSINYHLGFFRSLSMSVGAAYGHLLLALSHKRLVIFNARCGSAFVTQLRLQWLALVSSSRDKNIPLALTVQLLGTIDDLVSPADNIDLETGSDFIYLDMPFSGHKNVIEMDGTPAGVERLKVFTQVLTEDEQTLRAQRIVPSDFTLAQVQPRVTNVIFVIHGIRDEGYWTQKIALKVIALGQAPPPTTSVQPVRDGIISLWPI
jgi:hypothetical protein